MKVPNLHLINYTTTTIPHSEYFNNPKFYTKLGNPIIAYIYHLMISNQYQRLNSLTQLKETTN